MRKTSSLGFLGRLAGRLRWASYGLALLLAVGLVPAANGADNLFNGGGDGSDWFDANNWSEGAIPFAGDATKIYDSFGVNIAAGAADYGGADLSIGDSDLGETATLNISGGTLNGTGTGNDIRLGVGDDQSGSLGRIIQTGGAVTAVDYIKMSNAGEQAAAGSHYQISGGSLSVVDQLEMGRDDGVVQNLIRFEVIGTGPTSIAIEDVKVNRVHLNSPAQPSFAFTIDGTATGVTSIDVNDELQLGNNENGDVAGVGVLDLVLSLSATPIASDIVLFNAKRISMDEQFEGLPDGSTVSAAYDGTIYGWTIHYFDNHESSAPVVTLSDLRVIPEPGSMVLLVMAAIPLTLGRRRSY